MSASPRRIECLDHVGDGERVDRPSSAWQNTLGMLEALGALRRAGDSMLLTERGLEAMRRAAGDPGAGGGPISTSRAAPCSHSACCAARLGRARGAVRLLDARPELGLDLGHYTRHAPTIVSRVGERE